MTQHSTGDKLASGHKTAQFSVQSGLSDFGNDLIYMTPEELVLKYGISEAQVEMYKSNRDAGNKLPDLVPVAIAEQMERDRREHEGNSLFRREEQIELIVEQAEHREDNEAGKHYRAVRHVEGRENNGGRGV